MDTEPTRTEEQWRLRTTTLELNRVTATDRPLSASTTLNNRTAMLAAADEMQTATRSATVCPPPNSCPDSKLWAGDAWLLNTSAEVALTAQRAATDWAVADRVADSEVMGRIGDLLELLDTHSHLLDS